MEQSENTRLFVKNLPLDLDELSLKKHFEQFGKVSDCRIQFRGDKNRGIAFVGFVEPAHAQKARKSMDKSYIGKQKINVDFARKFDKEVEEKSKFPQEREIDEKRLYLTNVPFEIDEQELFENLSKIIRISSIKILKDREGKSRGQAFASFENETETLQALSKLDNSVFMGRRLFAKKCLKSQNDADLLKKREEAIAQEPSSLKKLTKSKLLDRIEDPKTWAAAFLNPNLVLSRVAEKLNSTRRELLLEQKAFPAVTQTLAEKEVLEETLNFLEENGISKEYFSEAPADTPRSNKVIIVKNLPVEITQSEVEKLFGRHGKIERFLMVPNKAVAIVSFVDSTHAVNAFSQVSSFKFKGTPLYLEWAPKGIWEDHSLLQKREVMEGEEETSPVLLLKNLDFSALEEDVEKLLRSVSAKGWKSIKIVKSGNKSLGYGFVEFSTTEEAIKAKKNLIGKLLRGRLPEVIFSTSQNERESTRKSENQTYTGVDKLLLKNVAFQATKKELEELLGAIVRFKKVRLPSKPDGTGKGFAFVEFDSEEDCKNAFKELRNLHFYGKKLVLEFAQQ